MNEGILAVEEINLILQEAKNPKYSVPNIIYGGPKKTSIFRLSATTGLILICGDKNTGLKHISHRHSFGRQEWNEHKDTLNGASQFRLGVTPMYYLPIAEAIYKPENLDIENNDDPERFEMYSGNCTHVNGTTIEYRLLTYLGTGIIHTLFPTKSANNKKHGVELRASGTGLKQELRNGRVTYTISYYNREGNELFKIVVRGLRGHLLERWYIQATEESGLPPRTTFIKEIILKDYPQFPEMRGMSFEYKDLRWIEREMAKMMKGTFDFRLRKPARGELHTLNRRVGADPPSFFAW